MLSVAPILVHGTYRSRRLEAALACLTHLLSALASPRRPPRPKRAGSPLPNGATEKPGKGGWGRAASPSAGRPNGVCCCTARLDMGSPLPFCLIQLLPFSHHTCKGGGACPLGCDSWVLEYRVRCALDLHLGVPPISLLCDPAPPPPLVVGKETLGLGARHQVAQQHLAVDIVHRPMGGRL